MAIDDVRYLLHCWQFKVVQESNFACVNLNLVILVLLGVQRARLRVIIILKKLVAEKRLPPKLVLILIIILCHLLFLCLGRNLLRLSKINDVRRVLARHFRLLVLYDVQTVTEFRQRIFVQLLLSF